MEGGIKRAMLDLQDFVGSMFDGVSDGVAVRRAEDQSLQDQQIECTLEHFA